MSKTTEKQPEPSTSAAAAPKNAVPEDALLREADPSKLILGALFDVSLMLKALHPSYMRHDITGHLTRFEARIAKLKEIVDAHTKPKAGT